jgi:hypothetical protein
MPSTSYPYPCTARITTARITALSPAQSPPVVMMPSRLSVNSGLLAAPQDRSPD